MLLGRFLRVDLQGKIKERYDCGLLVGDGLEDFSVLDVHSTPKGINLLEEKLNSFAEDLEVYETWNVENCREDEDRTIRIDFSK
ncbi:hypothetical protein GCM10027167_86340 [Nocardia heshunensis]